MTTECDAFTRIIARAGHGKQVLRGGDQGSVGLGRVYLVRFKSQTEETRIKIKKTKNNKPQITGNTDSE